MVDSAAMHAKRSGPIIAIGILGEILLGGAWLVFTKILAEPLGMSTISLRTLLIAATITSLILAIIVSIFYYRTKKDMLFAIMTAVILTIFGIFASAVFTVGIGFMAFY